MSLPYKNAKSHASKHTKCASPYLRALYFSWLKIEILRKTSVKEKGFATCNPTLFGIDIACQYGRARYLDSTHAPDSQWKCLSASQTFPSGYAAIVSFSVLYKPSFSAEHFSSTLEKKPLQFLPRHLHLYI